MIRLFKLTRKTWEESTEWREPITMKPLLGILNRSRRKEMLHCKKNKKVLKWTVHQCPKKEKHHINMISNTYIIAGRQELHLVGWRTVAKKNCVKSEEKKKQKHYFKFCIAVSNLLPLLYCHKSHTNLAFTSTRFLKRCPKSRPRTKKNNWLNICLRFLLLSWALTQHWEKNFSPVISFKVFYTSDLITWPHLIMQVVIHQHGGTQPFYEQEIP